MLKKTLSTCILLALCCAPLAVVAQQDEHRDVHSQQQYNGHDDHAQQQYVEHKEWKRGYHMNHDDWDRGRPVDYRANHLHQPRSGYEWRELDGNYVMAHSHTGVVDSVVVVRH